MPGVNVLIKPTSDECNLDCTYCFYHDVSHKRIKKSFGRMSLETIEKVIERVFEFADQFASFAFQGGEPMLQGIAFYEQFLSIIPQYNTRNVPVYCSMQTNGVLIDSKWAKFFKRNHFLIGLSIDGHRSLHDKYRVDYGNKPTHMKVVNGLRLLQQYGVEYNVLQVVTKETTKHIQETYDFFQKHGVKFVQIIPVLDPLLKGFNNYDYSLSAKEYGEFLSELFDIWYTDFKHRKEVRITYFENLVTMLQGHMNINCGLSGRCSIQYVIEADGSIYPCDFYVIDQWKLGNVHTDDFGSILTKKRSQDFIRESIDASYNCRTCKYYDVCQGGCKRHRLNANGFYEENHFCAGYQLFFDHTYKRLLELSQNEI